METRDEREKRLAEEYAAYLEDCKAKDHPPINYMNWAHGKKIEEQWE